MRYNDNDHESLLEEALSAQASQLVHEIDQVGI